MLLTNMPKHLKLKTTCTETAYTGQLVLVTSVTIICTRQVAQNIA